MDDETKCPPDGRLPDAAKGPPHLRDIFYRMGFNDQEIVALSGAHALGRCAVLHRHLACCTCVLYAGCMLVCYVACKHCTAACIATTDLLASPYTAHFCCPKGWQGAVQ